MVLNLNKRLLSTLIFIFVLLLLAKFSGYSSPASFSTAKSRLAGTSLGKGATKDVTVGPGAGVDEDDDNREDDGDDSDWCSRVAGQRYLDDLASTWTVSCSVGKAGEATSTTSSSSLICFQAQVEEEPDNFCVAKNAVYKSNPPPPKPFTPEDLFPPNGITAGGGINNNNHNGGGGGGGKKNTPPMRPFKRGIVNDAAAAGGGAPAHYNSHTRRETSSPWSASSKKWSLNCWSNQEWEHGVQAPYKFRTYFSGTGAGEQLRAFDMSVSAEKLKDEVGCKESIMLVRLEGGGNLWHTLMEVWSAVLTLDVLEKAGPAREKLFGKGVGEERIWEEENVKVYIENMESEVNASPVFGLWSVVTGKEVKDVKELKDGCYKSVVLPLAGGANPFWKDHWKERRCEGSALVDRFVEKVMKFYGVEDAPAAISGGGGKVKVRIIGRQHNRKILRLFDYVKNLQKTYPDADIQVTKLEKMSVTEQLRMMRETDILIGVTGAGLTHTMFLTKGAAVVELTQPEPFVYFGFGNIARMRGLEYFAVQAEKREGKSKVNWQEDNVLIDEKTLVEVMGKAIEGQQARKRTQTN